MNRKGGETTAVRRAEGVRGREWPRVSSRFSSAEAFIIRVDEDGEVVNNESACSWLARTWDRRMQYRYPTVSELR